MSNVRIAAPEKQRIVPAFSVQKLDGQVERKIIQNDAKGKRTETIVKEDAGYMVKFSKGHSIRVRNERELERLGFDRTIPLVDDDGEIHGEIDNSIMTPPKAK